MKAYISTLILSSLLILPLKARAEDLIEIEHLWVTQDVHVPGDALCQDGEYIYFKDLLSCHQSLDASFCQNVKQPLSPITFIEKISLPSGDSVSHFFNVSTSYDYLRYELVEQTPIKNYELVQSLRLELPVCTSMTMKPKKKIRKIRKARKNELAFMQGLVDSGVSIVNSPYGRFDPGSHLNNTTTSEDPRRPKLRSPLCNTKLNYKDLVTQASGEWTGNGIVEVDALNQWHNDSMDLYIQKTKLKTGEEHFEFFCRGEADDL